MERTLDEAIAHAKEVARKNRSEYEFECSYYGKEIVDNGEKLDCMKFAEEHEQLAEWLEKLKYIENIMLKWNADWYNDEDNGIPDNEILEAIFNACTDNGFDIPIDEDFSKGYNKAIADFAKEVKEAIDIRLEQVSPISDVGSNMCAFYAIVDEIAEQLKEGGAK